jgi:membrane-bound lytic murein transglycosylase D
MYNNNLLLRLTAGFVLLLTAAFSQADERFPRPAALEPAIQFWIRVYTEIDTDAGFLHDARNMGVIYRSVPFDRREIERYRTRIESDLRVLASGKRDGLSGHQQQVLEAWPENVSNAMLAEAANNVRFQRGQSDRFIEGMVRSGAYREHIHQVARERGMPVELGVLPHVESSFHPGVYSHANAAGMWQFMRATGERLMRVDDIVDERMDPFISTHAAMSLLQTNYNQLGTWPLALTAYNQGAARMARAVRDTGTDRIEEIIAHHRGPGFGFAGRNFYPQFLAVLELEDRANALFGVLQLDPAPEYVEFELPGYIEAHTLADYLGVSLRQLRFDNPALRPIVWEGGKRIPNGFPIKVQRRSLTENADRLIARIPGSRLYAYQTPDVSYVVQRGDSLSVIARRFDTSIGQLVSLNRLPDQHTIRAGQELLLPHDTVMASQTLQMAANDARPSDEVYQVRSGDTLSSIARRLAVAERDLLQVNRLSNPDRLRVGQELRLPLREGAEPSSTMLAGAETGGQEAAAAAVLTAAVATRSLAELLASDPSDYTVANDGSIEIQASETLGHYADWLGVRADELRRLNNLGNSQALIVGNRLRLAFDGINASEFEERRRRFHAAQQEQFFRSFRIQELDAYQVAANDNIAAIARQRYSVPLWLLRQYNPDLDFRQVRVGQTVVFPVVEPADGV